MSVNERGSGIGNLAGPYYTGLSSDQKPTPTTDVATFFELDTGTEYVWCRSLLSGEAAWWPFQRQGAGEQASAQAQVLTEILSELRRIRRGVEMALQTEIPDPGE